MSNDGASSFSNTADASGLQSQVRDLAALLALQARWRGRDLPFIAAGLVDTLVSLLRLDAAYFRLDDPAGGPPLEEFRPDLAAGPSVLRDELRLQADQATPPLRTVEHPLGGHPLRILHLNSRLGRESAVVVVGSVRPRFPTDVETFLLRTAVEQGMVALQGTRLLRDLQLANQAKATFLATMSHELRTPLNAILGYIDLLDAGVAGELNAPQKGHLDRVRAGGKHLLQLIEGILTFARVEAGKESAHLQQFDLCALVQETASLVEPLARVRGLGFETLAPAGPILVTSDVGKLRQILLNLLSNSMKFTNSGKVEVEIRILAEQFQIIVRDTGVGIPSDELEAIFEPFRQVGDVYTGKAAGTGLGLSVSRQLARILGGDIQVQSTLGEGSTFTATFPI